MKQLLNRALTRAQSGRTGFLNFIMAFVVPFNRPHGVRILLLGPDEVISRIPMRRRNQNHLGGIHAAALCTIGEYPAGILLINRFPPDKFRLILARLDTTYERQARTGVTASAVWPGDTAADNLNAAIEKDGKGLLNLVTTIRDDQVEVVARVETTWQVKPWDRVRLK